MAIRFVSQRRVLVAPACVLAAGWAQAQSNPANGKALFEGNSIQPCTACHGDVQNRRDAIDPGGDVDFDLALARFLGAINAQPLMNKFGALTAAQKNNIAAYIADVPKARPTPVDFTATAVNTETAAQTITFSNAATSSATGGTSAAPLTINTVGITSPNPTDFLIKTGGSCGNNVVLAASGTCTVNVSFRTGTGSTKTGLLGITYTQGASTVTRTAQLNGAVAGASPPAGSSASGGGGALPVGGLALLLTAAWRRRRPWIESRP